MSDQPDSAITPPAAPDGPAIATPATDAPTKRAPLIRHFDVILSIFGLLAIVGVAVANLLSGDRDEAIGDLGRSLGFYAVWWVSFFGWNVLTQLVGRRAEDDDKRALKALPLDRVTVPAGNEKVLEAGIEALTDYIDRLESNIDRMEKTAALVPGALGLIATVAVARLNTDVTGLPVNARRSANRPFSGLSLSRL